MTKTQEKIENFKKSKTAMVLRWVFTILGIAFLLVAAFADKLFGKENILSESVGEIVNFVDKFSEYLPVILKSVAWTSILLLISRLFRWAIKLIYSKARKDKRTAVKLADSMIKYAFLLIIVFKLLDLWGVDTTTLLASAGILGLVVGLGAQSLIADVLSGLFIVFERPFMIGDIVTVEDFRGVVQEIGIRNTKIMDDYGNVKVISNSAIKDVINMTSALSLIICDVAISHDEPQEKIRKIFVENLAIMKSKITNIEEGPFFKGIGELGRDCYIVKIMAKCKEENRFQTIRDLNGEIKRVLDENGVKIPPQKIQIITDGNGK